MNAEQSKALSRRRGAKTGARHWKRKYVEDIADDGSQSVGMRGMALDWLAMDAEIRLTRERQRALRAAKRGAGPMTRVNGIRVSK